MNFCLFMHIIFCDGCNIALSSALVPHSVFVISQLLDVFLCENSGNCLEP